MPHEEFLEAARRVAMLEAAQQARRDLYPAGKDSYRFACALLASWARASGVVGAPCRHLPAPGGIPTLKSLAATASIGAMRALPPYVSLSESEVRTTRHAAHAPPIAALARRCCCCCRRCLCR